MHTRQARAVAPRAPRLVLSSDCHRCWRRAALYLGWLPREKLDKRSPGTGNAAEEALPIVQVVTARQVSSEPRKLLCRELSSLSLQLTSMPELQDTSKLSTLISAIRSTGGSLSRY